MIGIILGLAFLVIAVFFTYKKAKENGYNPILWAFITVVVYIGIQFLIGFAFAIFIGIGIATNRLEPNSFGLATIMNIIAWIASIGGVMLVLRYVSRIKDDGEVYSAPPAPPKFNQ